jgi:hypothetical protein
MPQTCHAGIVQCFHGTNALTAGHNKRVMQADLTSANPSAGIVHCFPNRKCIHNRGNKHVVRA